jgi:hypothetical protein
MIAKLLIGLAFVGAAVVGLVVGACTTSPSNDDGFPDSGDEAAAPCPQLQFPTTCPTPPPSWQNDVQPLIVKYCDQCHGNGSTASTQLDLATYKDVANNRTKCWYQIYQCWMPNVDGSPPPIAYPTPAERQTMVTWLDVCNAPNN